MSVTVTLPDGNQLELPDGATGADAAAAIGPGLARAALAIEISAAAADGATARARRYAISRAHSPTAPTSRSSLKMTGRRPCS